MSKRSDGRNSRPVRIAITLAALAGVATALYYSALFSSGNAHVVAPGELYRSAQLSGPVLEKYIKQYGIASIINLRGENRNAQWYASELSDGAALHVKHFDFRMSAKSLLSRQRAEELIALMTSAPKPILIHCNSGSDRTSLAAALYMAAVKKVDEDTAEWQFSVKYGHFSLPFLRTYAVDESWENLEPWLGYPAS